MTPIGLHPMTAASVIRAVETYVAKMKAFQRECPTIVPRWMRLRSRPAFVLRHAGRYDSNWRIIRHGSCDSASLCYERESLRMKNGGIALVFLEYKETTTAARIGEHGAVEYCRETTDYQRELVGFRIEKGHHGKKKG